jgi:hypothetical protein
MQLLKQLVGIKKGLGVLKGRFFKPIACLFSRVALW